MRRIEHTAPTPEGNLAFDDALLVDPTAEESLRLWEADRPFVVLGRSSRLDDEVNAAACEARHVPILRRVSGGATIVTGPGCLMYAVTLDLTARPDLADLGRAHRYVLERVADAIRPVEPTIAVAGTSDLVVQRSGRLRKVSGNSLRRVRDRLLYHGTLLYDFDLPLITQLLATAPRQPDYRERRDHSDFVANLNTTAAALRSAIAAAWNARESTCAPSTQVLADQLIREKYQLDSWNRSR